MAFDPATSKVRDFGSLTDDEHQQYLLSPLVDRATSTIYCPVGLARRELWALDTVSGEKRQILPEEFQSLRSTLVLSRGIDGRIYARLGKLSFLCHSDRVERVEMPASEAFETVTHEGRKYTVFERDGRLVSIDKEGSERRLETAFPKIGTMIYSLPVEFEGKLLGSTWKPQGLFALDLESGKISDYGRVGSGAVQIYDILPTTAGLVLGSYGGGWIDLLSTLGDPQSKAIVSLDKEGQQERPVQLARGADGAVYVASMPIKGRLGGALSRVDVESGQTIVHRDVIANQGVTSVVAIPETRLLFCTSTIEGGTSAIPTEKEACIFLWDTETQAKVHEARPIAGAKSYVRAIALNNGLVFCLTKEGEFAIWDVAKQSTIRSGRMRSSRFKQPYVNPVPVWDGHHVIVYGASTIEAVNVNTGKSSVVLNAPDLAISSGFYTLKDGALIYGVGDTLHRRNLAQPLE